MASKRRPRPNPKPAPLTVPSDDGFYVKIPLPSEQVQALREVFESVAELVKAGLNANAALERARRLPSRRRR